VIAVIAVIGKNKEFTADYADERGSGKTNLGAEEIRRSENQLTAETRKHRKIKEEKMRDTQRTQGRTPITRPLNRRLTRSFENKPGLVVYVTCGDHNLAATCEIVLAACRAGAGGGRTDRQDEGGRNPTLCGQE
jgi:hypothetical protein